MNTLREYKLPEILCLLLSKNNMSQQQLADKLYTTQSVIYKWLKTGTQPTLDKLIQLSEVFNVSIDYLVFGDN